MTHAKTKTWQVHFGLLLAILFVALLLATASHQQQATEFQFNLLPNNNIGGINSMGDGLDATLSTLQTPACIGRDPNSTLLLICDGRNIVRKVTKDNLLITHLYNMDESITFFSPQAIAFDGQGGFFFTAGSMVYQAFPDATIRIYAGSYSTGQLDSTLSSSLFGNVVGLVKRQSTGLLYVADSTNHAIRLLNSTHVTTIGGSLGVSGYSSGSTAASSLLNTPTRLALSLDQNTLLFTDSGNNVVRSIDLTNMHIQTIAGNRSMGYSGDGGLAINARLNSPNGIIVSILGGFYISDTGNNLIRRVFSNGTIITICGTSSNLTVETTNPLSVRLNSPTDLFTQTLAGGGETLYIADSGNNRIRKIDFTGVNDLGKIQTVAGSGDIQYYGDTPGLDGSQVSLSNPKFLHVSPVTGNLLITDTDRLRVFSENRKLISSIPLTDFCFSASWFHRNSSDPGDIFYSVPYGVYQRTSNGATKLIAGSTSNYGFEKGLATATRFNNPSSVFVDGNDMYITDTYNHRIRYLDMASGIIQTIAGTGVAGYSGDGGPASNAKLNYPSSIFAAKYDIYFTDRGNDCVRKISRSTLNIDIVAGTPQQKFAGDDNFANRAVFNNPFGIAVVLAGTNKFDAYIADSDNHRIRKIGYDGNITTVGGTGAAGYNGDGIEATKASLYNPSGLAVSGYNLYICDTNNHLVRLLDLSSGKIGIIAGTPGKSGYAGDNGPATSAYLNYPSALAVSGNYLYIADTMNYVVRRVDLSSGNIITFAGTPGQSGSSGDGKQATSANLNRPIHLAIGSIYLYIATSGDDGATVRTVTLSSTIIGSLNIPFKKIGAIAFNGVDLLIFDPGNVMIYKYGFSTALIGGSAATSIANTVSPLTNAILYNVTAMTFASNGALWFADNVLGIIRKTDTGLLNYVYNVAGGVGDGLKPTEAILSSPEGLFHDGTFLYIADSGNHRVRRVGSSSITTIAGSGVKGVDNDSITTPLLARLNYPVSIAVTSGGVVYITDKGNNRIRKLSGNSITTIAGTGEAKFNYDITDPTKATLNQPHQIFLSPTEDLLYLAESAGHNLKVISFGKNIMENVLIDKDCPGGYNEVTDPKSTCLNSPLGVMVTGDSIYIADTMNNRIRSISSSVLKTIAGGIGDGGLAVNAFISFENYVFTSPYSNASIYIVDTYNHKIRQVSLTTGIITTIAGDYWIPFNWDSPFNGDNLLATKTNLNSPKAIAFAPNGDIYISDSTNQRVRKIFASNQTVTTLANNLLSPRQLDFYQGNGSLLISDITTVKQIRIDGSLQTVFDTSSTTGLSASLSSKIVYFTDLGLVKSFTLSCPSGYAESKKKTNCLPTCYGIISENTTVCSGNGTCMSTNNCTCNSGYYGNNCELISCYSKLSNNATVCSGNGICVSKDNCKCSSNYFGSECQYTTCNNTLSTLKTVCSSHGKCVAFNNCTCNEGYYGSNCENFYCYGVSNTLPSVCSGRGSCSSYNNCNCQSGYFGNLCEKYTCNGIEKNDTQVCSAHGICSSYNNCTCENGYYDSACASFDCNGVTSKLVACENNGTCSKPGACACVYGYDGDRCEFTRCYGVSASSSKICTGHGICLSPDNCQCNLGWDGVACNITQCYGLYSYDPTVCSGHGTCAGRDFCDCNKGYSGKYCHLKLCFGKEENDTSVCTGRGLCISPDTCQCESGYNGNECQHHEVFMDPYTVSIYSNHYRLMSQLEKDLLSCEEILTNTDFQYIGLVESRKCQWRKKTGFRIYLGYNHTIKHESVLSILGKLTIQLNATISDSIRAQAIGATFTKPLDRYPLGHDLVVRTNVNYLYHNFKEIKQSWSCIGCPSQIQTILDVNIGKPFLIIPASNLSLITTTSGTLRTLRLVTNSLNSLSTSVTNEYKYSFNPLAKTMPVNFDIWNEVTLGTDMFECVGHTCIIESSITGLNTSLSFTLNDFFIVLNKDFQDKQMFRLTNKLGVRVLESDYSGTCTVFGLHLITYSSSYYPIDISYTTFDNLDFYLTNVNRTHSKNSDISISVVSSDPFVTDFTPSDVFTLYWSCYKLPGMIYIPECDKTGEFSLDLKSGVLSVGSYMIGLMVVTTKSISFNFNGTIEITDTPLGSPRIEVDQLPSVYPYGDNLVLSSIVYSNSELELSWSLLEGDLNIDISNISSFIDSSTTISSLDGYNVQVSLSIDPTYLIEGERYTFQLVSSNINGRSSANISTQLDRSPRFSCDIYDPLGENYAYSSKFVIYCVNNLESISSYWMDVSDDSGNRIMLLSNTMKRKFITRLPYHNSGYLNIGIKLINRYGSFSRISRRVKVNSSLPSLSDRVKYLTSQYRVLSSSELTRIDTSISIGCLLSFYNMDEDLSSMDLSIKSSFVSTLVNMISSLKKIQDVSLNVDDKIIQLSLPVVHKIFLTLQKVSASSLPSSEVENWIKWIIQGVKKGSSYYTPYILPHLLDNQHAFELSKLYTLLVTKAGPLKSISLLPEVLDIVNTYQSSNYSTTGNSTKMAINLEQGGEGSIETLQSTNQLNGKVLIFNNYKNIQVEFPSSFSTDISASNFKMLSYAFDSQESSLISPVIEISLLSSSSENVKVENLNNRIKLKFTGLSLSRDAPTLVNATCVYFDTTSQTWISSGLSSQITIVKSEGGKVYFDLECQSSHLTSFSIQELPSIVQRNTSTTTNTDSTTTIILAVVIPVSLLLIVAVIVVIATIIGLVAYFKRREERIKLNNSASNTNNMQELQYLSGNIDFPSNESMFYKPLMSIRADSDTGSLDRSTSFDPLSRYTDLVRIGQGAFGSVFKANDSKNEGKVKALKVIKYSSFEELNNIMKEGTQLMNIEHPNILKVNEVFVNQDQLLIIDMDFYEMGDLTKLTDASFICSEPLIKKILYQMCSALDYVHTVKKMIHRDIKPSNIFIKSLSHDDIQVIIADFGLAKQSQGSIQNSYAGTPLFMSPELAVGGKYNSNTDMYSLGVAIFQIMTKDTSSSISEQYLTKDPNQVIQWLTERMEEPKLYSKELIQIILSMLNKNSAERPHADSIVQLPYFQ